MPRRLQSNHKRGQNVSFRATQITAQLANALTTSLPRAHSTIRRVRAVSTGVADLGFQDTFSIAEVLAEEVLHTPETSGGYRGGLRVGRHVARGGRSG